MAEAFVVAAGPAGADRSASSKTRPKSTSTAISDGDDVIVAGIMEHIEEAGVHSGDSACAIPPYSLPGPVVEEIRDGDRRAGAAS